MLFNGEFRVSMQSDAIWPLLADPARFLECVPGIRCFQIVGENKFEANVRSPLTAIPGSFDFEFSYAEKIPPRHSKIIGSGKGLKSTLQFACTIDLKEEQPGATLVSWSIESNATGMVARLGQRVLTSAIESTAQKVVANLQTKLKTEAVQR